MTFTFHEFNGEHSLTFPLGDLGSDAAVEAADHEPNGYFWEGVVQFEWPDLAAKLEFDSEGSMFAAVGATEDLEALQARLETLIDDSAGVADLIRRANQAGFQFDD